MIEKHLEKSKVIQITGNTAGLIVTAGLFLWAASFVAAGQNPFTACENLLRVIEEEMNKNIDLADKKVV